MIRKLYKKLTSLFSQKAEIKPPVIETKKEKQAVEIDFSTGAVKYPDDITQEEKDKIDAEIKEFTDMLQKNAPEDLFKSFEDYLKNSSSANFTKANHLPDAHSQVMTEINNCNDDTDHWNDADFIEALYGFYSQGYDFPGIEIMNEKINSRTELSKAEQKKLRDWYILASQDLVYDT